MFKGELGFFKLIFTKIFRNQKKSMKRGRHGVAKNTPQIKA